MMQGLADVRVIDFSTGYCGAYCTKLLADGGADVIKVESPEGDPLRRWSATGADLGGADSAIFRYLHTSKRSIVGQPRRSPRCRASSPMPISSSKTSVRAVASIDRRCGPAARISSSCRSRRSD